MGAAGATGDADGVPWVTPSSTWFVASPCCLSRAQSHTVSMRGWPVLFAATAGVLPPSHGAQQAPSPRLALRLHTATPAATW